MIEFIQSIDDSIMLAANGSWGQIADTFMYVYSGRWVWVPLYFALLIMLMRRYGWRNAMGFLIVVVALIAVTDQTCATLIRPAVERLRPSNLDNPLSASIYIVNGYRGGAYGFPSCHAANTLALATFFVWLTRSNRLGITLFIWAGINCYSRLYLGVHYPTDLLVGGLIGAGYGTLAYWALRWYVNMPDIRGNRFTTMPLCFFLATVAGILLYAVIW